jgi:uncharacterized protein
VYIMHAGWPMLDDLLAVLWTHPQVNVDVGAICFALSRKEFHHYLERIVDAGFASRVMFGSDQMNWPGVIEYGIEAIESATFLTPKQKATSSTTTSLASCGSRRTRSPSTMRDRGR